MTLFYQVFIRNFKHDDHVYLSEASAKEHVQKHVRMMKGQGALIKDYAKNCHLIEVSKTDIYSVGIDTLAIPDFYPDPLSEEDLTIYQVVSGGPKGQYPCFSTLEKAREQIEKMCALYKNPKNPLFSSYCQVLVDTPDQFTANIGMGPQLNIWINKLTVDKSSDRSIKI